jgi:hypothetical protein
MLLNGFGFRIVSLLRTARNGYRSKRVFKLGRSDSFASLTTGLPLQKNQTWATPAWLGERLRRAE